MVQQKEIKGMGRYRNGNEQGKWSMNGFGLGLGFGIGTSKFGVD